MTDTRYVYGALCSWHGPIQEVGTYGPLHLPCCPICQRMLFEQEDRTSWDVGIAKFNETYPGYKDFMDYIKKPEGHFLLKDISTVYSEYDKAHGTNLSSIKKGN